jgi:hypothetical protein
MKWIKIQVGSIVYVIETEFCTEEINVTSPLYLLGQSTIAYDEASNTLLKCKVPLEEVFNKFIKE